MKLFSNEIVFAGHPDKVADRISASILKECIAQDKKTRAGIEVVGGKGKIFVTGEITTNANINVKKITKDLLKKAGYSTKYKIINNIGTQSNDIAQGTNDDIGGAGDQGFVIGYACNDTPQMLPLAQVILQDFAKAYESLRESSPNLYYSDGKAQITGYYDEETFKLQKIKTFLISYQNCETMREETDEVIKYLANKCCQQHNIEIEEILINPTGRFCIGQFEGDSGLTGRKIVVDAYHSFAHVGGGCMNGKDPSKVDFSGAYKARELACRILSSYDFHWVEVQICYAIGIARPLSIYVNTNEGSYNVKENIYEECKPQNIIKDLKLYDLDFEEQAKFGHFTQAYINKVVYLPNTKIRTALKTRNILIDYRG